MKIAAHSPPKPQPRTRLRRSLPLPPTRLQSLQWLRPKLKLKADEQTGRCSSSGTSEGITNPRPQRSHRQPPSTRKQPSQHPRPTKTKSIYPTSGRIQRLTKRPLLRQRPTTATCQSSTQRRKNPSRPRSRRFISISSTAWCNRPHAGLAKLEGLTDDRSVLDALRAEVAQKAPQSASAAPQEIAVEEPGFAVAEQETESWNSKLKLRPRQSLRRKPRPNRSPCMRQAPQRAPATLDDFVADLEASLPDDFMAPAGPIPPAHVIASPQAPQTHRASLSTAPVPQSTGHGAAVQPALAQPPAAVIPAAGESSASNCRAGHAPVVAPVLAPAAAEAGADLNDMFDELRAGLADESAPAEEDPEDHYNLGVAFREMGLIDEAIGELQKVCQAIDRGTPFQVHHAGLHLARAMLPRQRCPRGLHSLVREGSQLPNLDEEARTALHYELASAYGGWTEQTRCPGHSWRSTVPTLITAMLVERIHALEFVESLDGFFPPDPGGRCSA